LEYGALRSTLEAIGAPSLENIREAVISIRQSKLPDPKVTGNAGSFFKNPTVPLRKAELLGALHPDMPRYPATEGMVKLAAGWLIEKAGLKGVSEGSVAIHPKQALIIINRGGATGAEIAEFSHKIIEEVERLFGIELESEVNIL
jgi:UDP-N-acetylmuramate dehydrogenase